MSIPTKYWKILNLTYNFFFGILGAVLFIYTAILLYKLFIYRHFIGISIEYPIIVLIVIAISGCLVAWIGWKVSWTPHGIHVVAFGILLIMMVVLLFACFIWTMVASDQLDIHTKENINEYFKLVTTQNDTNIKYQWDKIQSQMQCCGVSGPGDYRSTGLGVPWSCCGQGLLDALESPLIGDCTSIFQRGCAKQLYEYAYNEVFFVAMIALGAVLFQSVGVFSTFFFAASIAQRGGRTSGPRISAKDYDGVGSNEHSSDHEYF